MQADKTILHIEDNLENRVLVRRLLTSQNYRVIEASDAFEAVECLHRYTPDLILMDINLPEVDGYTLTTKLKSIPRVKNIPIIAITANVLRGDREKTLLAGCDGYIEKPIDVEDFLVQVAFFLGQKP